MKKIFSFLLILAVVFTAGCKKSDDNNANGDKPKASYNTAFIKPTPLDASECKDITLKYHPVKGATYKYRVTTTTEDEVIQSIPDRSEKQSMSQKILYDLKFTVDEIATDGTIDGRITVTSINADVMTDKDHLTYQSGESMDSSKQNQFVEYESIVNNPFNIRVRPNGMILDIYKVEAIIDKGMFMQKISKDTLSNEHYANVRDQITGNKLFPIALQLFKQLSNEPVSQNSTWAIKQLPVNFQILMFDNKIVNTLIGMGTFSSEKFAQIRTSINSKTIINPDAKRGGYNVDKASLNGTGELLFNYSQGMYQRNQTTFEIVTAMNTIQQTQLGPKLLNSNRHTKSVNTLELLAIE